MSKIKVNLFGKHGNRTPLSYQPYIKLFSPHIEYVSDPCSADILVTGFRIDYLQNKEILCEIKKKNPGVKLAVLSEEPLWDTLWGGDYISKVQYIDNHASPGGSLEIFMLNHFNSDIFNFKKIPYFITTDDNFFVRYNFFFARNSRLKLDYLLNLWKSAPVRTAFFAARREGAKYLHQNRPYDVLGLSVMRSEVGALFRSSEGALHVGQGWGDVQPRQSLNDWHLDKLAMLDKRAYVISAFENTHAHNYISEKIFDAFSTLGVPIYYASQHHRVSEICNAESFLNAHSLSPEEIKEVVLDFQISRSFASNYLNTQHQLSQIFKSPGILLEERQALVSRTLKAIKASLINP